MEVRCQLPAERLRRGRWVLPEKLEKVNYSKTKKQACCTIMDATGLFHGAPGMGNDLVVKVHYRLGSRNC